MFAQSKPPSIAIAKRRLFQLNSILRMSTDVRFHVDNKARVISLNRSAKLNALSTDMCHQIVPRLLEYSKSDSNNLIVLRSDEPRAFCSGGDVVQCAKDNLAGQIARSVEFFTAEYNLNYLLATFNKPIVSLVNGIVMGGGVGLSVHGPFRVVCETTRFAMPETNIGFFPDVGTSFWLSRLDGNLGYYLALTGDELHGFDSLIAGFGTHYVPSHRFDALLQRLANIEQFKEDKSPKEFYSMVDQAIEDFVEPIPQDYKFKFSPEELNTIEAAFDPKANPSVESVISALEADGSDFALKIVETLQSKSPISLKVAYELLQRSAKSKIYEAISNELVLANNMMTGVEPNDFNERILKNLINRKSTNPEDKIIKPAFKTLQDIPDEVVDNLLKGSAASTLAKPSSSLKEGEDGTSESDVLANARINQFFGVNYDQYPYNHGLPTQLEIENYVTGNDNSNRQYSVTRDEVLKYFDIKYKDKLGVSFKVQNVLDRKTKSSDYGEQYLQWI
ncbi:hypothetical protein LJB42_003968 [Komagataella kurtzmanii]|nr:hypothetical protein LJB42_003968 [Komagataella kurtzmanii]